MRKSFSIPPLTSMLAGKLDAQETCTSSLGRGGWKRTRDGNALAAYSTFVPICKANLNHWYYLIDSQ
jgi:hypothetical protein